VDIVLDRKTTTTFKTNPDGTITVKTKTNGTPEASTEVDRDKSWIDPASKDDKELLKHEKGHVDETEKNTRELQAELNKKQAAGDFMETKTLPPGISDTDLDKEISEQEARVLKKIDDLLDKKKQENTADNEKYDDDTAHGDNEAAQVKARKAQIDALKQPNTDSDNKKGADAKSESEHSVRFVAATGLLSFDEGFLIGIDPRDSGFTVDPSDPALGAEVVLPVFSLVGEREDGAFFFTAMGADPELAIVVGADSLFTTELGYLVYDPLLNLFYGLGRSFEAQGGDSGFVEHLVSELTEDEPALFGIEIRPDMHFLDVSDNFTIDTTSPFTNEAGAWFLPAPISQPATLGLLGAGVWALGWRSVRRCRAVAFAARMKL
jgi:hypothetical protein